MRSKRKIRDRLAELRDNEDEYDELEEGGAAVEAEERGYVEALEECSRRPTGVLRRGSIPKSPTREYRRN